MKTTIRFAGVVAVTMAALLLNAVPAGALTRTGYQYYPGTPSPGGPAMCVLVDPASWLEPSRIQAPFFYVTRSPNPTYTGSAQYLFYRFTLEYWNGSGFAEDPNGQRSTGWINNGKMTTGVLKTLVNGRSLYTVPGGWSWRLKTEFAWTADVAGNQLLGYGAYYFTSAEYKAMADIYGRTPTVGTWGGTGFCTMP